MRFPFFRRTSDSLVRRADKTRRGSIFITTVFVFLAFTTLALGMVFMSQVYLKVAGLRKNSAQLDYASENGIKSGFHHLLDAIGSVPGPLILTELRSLDLMDSVRNGELRILEENLGLRFPVVIREAGGDTIWQSQSDCQLESMVEGDGYVSALFKLPIQSLGEIRHIPIKRRSALDVRVGVAAGHLPLPLFSLLINKALDASQKDKFAQANGISLRTSSRNLLAGALSASEEPLIPRDATPLLEKGLQTKLFRPQDLSDAKLRFALGLENTDAPVPEGVYLIQNSLGLGGIYVVGDIEEMVMAIEGTYQVVSFQMAVGTWTLKFSPSECRTEFVSPQGATAFDLVPLGIIMASGKINSLGGGAVDASGRAILVQDREISSLLDGVGLTIVASDKVDITSHLIAEGLRWRDGIPYLKEEQTQLVVYSTGQDFQQGVSLGGGISIDAGAPQNIRIQASLTAQGTGFEIAGNGRTVDLLGSLQAVDYVSGGNQLNLYSYLNPADFRSGFLAVPQTVRPVLLIPFLETLEWREF
jgi:hypothetical protein